MRGATSKEYLEELVFDVMIGVYYYFAACADVPVEEIS
jgi:hypothetical protein